MKSQGDQKILDVDCPGHLVHLCTGKGDKELSVNFEDFVIDIYHHFRRSAKRKSQPREFMNFNNIEVKKVISNASTRWLILGRCLEKTLVQWYSWNHIFLISIWMVSLIKSTQMRSLSEKRSR